MHSIDLNEIAVFIQVVQAGSFTRAAEQLHMPNSTVSARVSSLEKRLGVTLLQRTTRQLNLTDVGRAYFTQCVHGLEEIAKAESDVTSKQIEPSGDLRISAPVYLGAAMLPKVISEIKKNFPKIHIEFVLKDRAMDFISEKIDVALRAGDLDDSTLVAKKVGMVQFAAFASPAYIKAKGELLHPKELRKHQCIQFTPLGKDIWRFFNGKNWVSAPLSGQFLIDELHIVKELAMSGEGVALLPTFDCRFETKERRLVQVLSGWQSVSRQIHLVHLPQKYPSPKLRAFIDVASEIIRKQLVI